MIDGGTSSMCSTSRSAIRNCIEMLDVGGHFFAHTMANNFMGHGFYQFSPGLFYRVFCAGERLSGVHRIGGLRIARRRGRMVQGGRPEGESASASSISTGGRPICLVHAERVADVPMFAAAPQQADYAARWSRNEARPNADAQAACATACIGWAKSHNEMFLRYPPGPLYDLALSALVRGLPKRRLRRRRSTPLPTLQP